MEVHFKANRNVKYSLNGSSRLPEAFYFTKLLFISVCQSVIHWFQCLRMHYVVNTSLKWAKIRTMEYIQFLAMQAALGVAMPVSQSTISPDWNLNNSWMNCHEILDGHSLSPEDASYWHWWSPDFSSRATMKFWLLVKYLDNYWMDCHEIWFTYPLYHGDESYWLWWSLNFSFLRHQQINVFNYPVKCLSIY